MGHCRDRRACEFTTYACWEKLETEKLVRSPQTHAWSTPKTERLMSVPQAHASNSLETAVLKYSPQAHAWDTTSACLKKLTVPRSVPLGLISRMLIKNKGRHPTSCRYTERTDLRQAVGALVELISTKPAAQHNDVPSAASCLHFQPQPVAQCVFSLASEKQLLDELPLNNKHGF